MKKFGLIVFVNLVGFGLFLISTKAQIPIGSGGGVAGGGGGTTVTVAAPYIVINGVKYVSDTMWPFTALFSGAFLDANTATINTQTNGQTQMVFAPASALNAWYSKAATTSCEIEFRAVTNSNNSIFTGCWICDTTNSFLYAIEVETASNTTEYFTSKWTLASCAGTPSAPATNTFNTAFYGTHHLKLSVSGGIITAAVSQDGGQSYQTLTTFGSIGTISKGGVDIRSGTAQTIATTFVSAVVI